MKTALILICPLLLSSCAVEIVPRPPRHSHWEIEINRHCEYPRHVHHRHHHHKRKHCP